jgi:hypothetical protein
MKEIKICFDYLQGPVWKDKVNVTSGEMTTGIKCVDNDITVQTLNDKAEELYSSLYSFDEYGQACHFNEQAYENLKPQLLGIVKTIIYRLQEINDGTFTIKDEATSLLSMEKGKVS